MQIEQSAGEIAAAIDDCVDLALIRGAGNTGDELILEGTRALLSDRRFREIELDQLAGTEAELALLVGGGAFSAAYHEWAPWALRVAEQRFQRVIVLPSTFDLAVRSVRETLASTSAIVFARERETFERIRDLCDARLALDGAFYYDFEPYRRDGSGVLNAFRTDREAPAGWQPPTGNDDISVTAGSLPNWLDAIADRAVIRTNRAHVMIAAAMLDKQVEVGPCRSSKLRAIADYALGEKPLRWLPAAEVGRARLPARAPARNRGDHRR